VKVFRTSIDVRAPLIIDASAPNRRARVLQYPIAA
jgi:hypothetical protein